MGTGSRRYGLNRCPKWVRLSVGVWLVLVIQLVAQCVTAQGAAPVKAQARLVPPPFKHVVIVIEENKGYSDIIGKDYAPYINELAQEGASFSNAHGEWHPSQPNYLALFSGLPPRKNAQDPAPGAVGDECILPNKIPSLNLAGELRAKQLSSGKPSSFGGYAEDMPSDALSKCYEYDKNNDSPVQDKYVSKHTPWVNFADAQPKESLPWTPGLASRKDYSFLPTISIVISNDWHNMHPTEDNHGKKPPHEEVKCGDGESLFMDQVDQPKSVRCGDDWLRTNMSNYVAWAKQNNSLLIVTWDEDSSTEMCHATENKAPVCRQPLGDRYPDMEHYGTLPAYNIIPTIFVGAGVKPQPDGNGGCIVKLPSLLFGTICVRLPLVKPQPGGYGECITHYDILHTLEVMYKLPLMGETNNPHSAAINAACPGRWTSQPITGVWGE